MTQTLEAALSSGDLAGAAALWPQDTPPSPLIYEMSVRALIAELSGDAREEHLQALWPLIATQPVVGEANNFVPAIVRIAMIQMRLEPKAFERLIAFIAANIGAVEGETAELIAFGLQLHPDGPGHDAAVVKFALNSGFGRFCVFFDFRYRRHAGALARWMRGADLSGLNGEQMFALCVFASTLSDEDADKTLAQCARFDDPVPSAEGVLGRAQRLRNAPRKALRSPPRIALCVSGQLRGYDRCAPTWAKLGFEAPNVDTFVHTWRNIGRKYPFAGHAERCFSGAFIDAFRSGVRIMGQRPLEQAYPSLFAWFKAHADIDEAALRDLYKTDHIVIEDDSTPAFASFSNSDKMYDKTQRCYELARDSGRDYDLIVRIRPDKPVQSAAALDWIAIGAELSAKRKIYADVGPFLHYAAQYGIGDQFAVGDTETMALYSTAYEQTRAAKAAPRYGFPGMCHPHSNFAAAAFAAGIRVAGMPNVVFGPPVDSEAIGVRALSELVRRDIRAAPRHEVDRIFLAAIEQDMASA
ncbi:MAG: hypothetical protein ABUS57_07330 [Pseudomonadota bacterium]